MLQRLRTFSNAMSDLAGLRYLPQFSRSRKERVTVRPTFCFTMFAEYTFSLVFIGIGIAMIVVGKYTADTSHELA